MGYEIVALILAIWGCCKSIKKRRRSGKIDRIKAFKYMFNFNKDKKDD